MCGALTSVLGITMNCPADKKPNVKQFSDDVDQFWQEFKIANASMNDIELGMHFDRRYAHCFATVLGACHLYDTYNLPPDIKAKISKCMLGR